MRSRWQTELGFLAAQALVEVLPVWLLVTLVQHSAGMLTEVSFTQVWWLQLCAAALAWVIGRSQLGTTMRVLLLVAAAALLLSAAELLPSSPSSPSSPPSGHLAAWVLSGYLCVRGLFMGLHLDRPGAALHWFKLGSGFCALFFAFIALSATPRAALPFEQLRSLSVAYLFCGALLCGLQQRRTTLASAALTPAALVSVLAPTLVLMLCSVLLVFGPEAAGLVVRSGIATLSHTASLLRSAFGLLGTWLVSFLHWFGGLFEPMRGTAAAPRDPIAHGPPGMWNAVVRFREIAWRADDSEVVAVLVLLLGALALVHALVSLARKRSSSRAATADVTVHEEQHTTLSWQQLLQPLQRLRSKRTAPLPPSAATASSMRAIYRALLSWAAQRGQPRRPSTTPTELARQLSAQHPAKGRALSELTDYYTKERYAERTCTDPEQAHARELLQELTR